MIQRMTSVIVANDGPIATITLNRPEALNAFNAEMAIEWVDACRSTVMNDGVLAIIVRGEGPAFCAGGDVKAMHEMSERTEELTNLAREINAGILALVESSKPVVAAAHGATVGGGLGILLSTDYAILGESSKIASLYSNVGLTPDLSVSALLARAVGERRALALTLSTRMLSAAEALDWGIAAEVIADGDVGARAQEVAEGWIAAPNAFGQAKRLLRSSPYRSFAEQLEQEATTIGIASMTAEAEARIAAFVNR